MGYHRGMKIIRGFSLVEVLIVAAVVSLFFGGLFLTIQNSLRLISDSRGRLAALTIANDQIEYLRSLSYNSVGTISGLPSGNIPQISTTSLNGIVFTKRVLVEYVDDAADGVGTLDSNSITTDFKRVKVEVSWLYREESRSVFLVTNITPRAIETDVGGGTIRVNVFDATVAPLSGAQVRLLNNSGTTSIDITKTTDASGVVLFGGAPAKSGYQVFVTRAGYSSDQTRVATGTLANPTNQPVSVVEDDVSTLNFFIDELGHLSVTALSARVDNSSTTVFSSLSVLATSSNTSVVGGSLELTSVGGYVPSGTAFLPELTPSPLDRWHYVVASSSVPINTDILLRVYTVASSTYTLVPDTDLPGNSTGFVSKIDLSPLNVASYPSLVIGATLSTSNNSVTPKLHALSIWYSEDDTYRASTALTFTGEKTIGTDGALSPIYKTNLSGTTNAFGGLSFTNIEWDAYRITSPTYDVAEVCDGGLYPVLVSPSSTTTVEMILVTPTDNTLRVVVEDSLGMEIPGALVTLSKGEGTKSTSHCGQVFFGSLAAADDYVLTVTAPGYGTVEVNPLDITGDVVEIITL